MRVLFYRVLEAIQRTIPIKTVLPVKNSVYVRIPHEISRFKAEKNQLKRGRSTGSIAVLYRAPFYGTICDIYRADLFIPLGN